jgi:hypothetical protein
MKLLSPEVISENTRETDVQELQTGHWVISASVSGTTSFSGSFGCEPQASTSTIYFYGTDAIFMFRTAKSSRVRTATVSNYQPVKSHWFSVGSDSDFSAMSPALTEDELHDLDASEKELERGQGKRFKDPKALLKDLDS